MSERITSIKRTISVEGEQEEPRPMNVLGGAGQPSLLATILGCLVLSVVLSIIFNVIF